MIQQKIVTKTEIAEKIEINLIKPDRIDGQALNPTGLLD